MPDTATETLTLPVAGMTCDHCVGTVRRAMEAVPGVLSARVTLQPGQAEVDIEPDRVERNQLEAAIASAGYSVPAGEGAGPAPQLAAIEPMPGPSTPHPTLPLKGGGEEYSAPSSEEPSSPSPLKGGGVAG